MIFTVRFYTSCVTAVFMPKRKLLVAVPMGSNPATAVWAVLTNHQTKINNDQNDLSSMPKMT